MQRMICLSHVLLSIPISASFLPVNSRRLNGTSYHCVFFSLFLCDRDRLARARNPNRGGRRRMGLGPKRPQVSALLNPVTLATCKSTCWSLVRNRFLDGSTTRFHSSRFSKLYLRKVKKLWVCLSVVSVPGVWVEADCFLKKIQSNIHLFILFVIWYTPMIFDKEDVCRLLQRKSVAI